MRNLYKLNNSLDIFYAPFEMIKILNIKND